jgi:hypothetical protein
MERMEKMMLERLAAAQQAMLKGVPPVSGASEKEEEAKDVKAAPSAAAASVMAALSVFGLSF